MKGGVNFVRAVSHVLVWILLAQFRPGPIIDFAIVSLFVCLQVFAVDFEIKNHQSIDWWYELIIS